MDNQERLPLIWPPAPSNQDFENPAPHVHKLPWAFIFGSFGIGACLGGFDVTRADSWGDWLSALALVCLGFCRPRLFWFSAFVLTLCLYVAHVVAIHAGLKPPYVERDTDAALVSWFSIAPNFVYALLGVLACKFYQWFCTRQRVA